MKSGGKKQTSKLKFKKVNCAPVYNKENDNYTCYTDKSLEKMKKLWNMRHKDNKILATQSRGIWLDLRNKMKNICTTEKCWLEQKFIKNNLDSELRKTTFVPDQPKEWNNDPNTWLNSLDIEGVMKQYEHAYKCFEFLGPSPIDFDENDDEGDPVWPELKELNIEKELNRGKNKIGIIFNLDTHNKDGSHWVAMFINIKNGKIYYFDSNGIAPPNRVKKLINRIKEQGKKIGIDFDYDYNKVEHQMEDTECGIYTLYFIIEMVKDRKWSEFINDNKTIPDEKMMELRNKYFNNRL